MCENGGLNRKDQEYYKEKAYEMLESLIDNYSVKTFRMPRIDFIDTESMQAVNSNSVTDRGVDECNLWGDYFYLEAVVRCLKKWNPYW